MKITHFLTIHRRVAPAFARFVARPTSVLLVLALAVSSVTRAPGQNPSIPESSIDPAAVAALDKMGAYLRTLSTFEVRANTTVEDVLDDGRKVQFAAVTDLLAKRPDRLRADVNSDRQERSYYFNGKEFTLFARRMNFYATVPAPPTIGEFNKQLEEKFGIEVPLVDLFRWGSSEKSDAPIKLATNIGTSMIDGSSCTHYSFRQPELDWQIWIQNGDFPLPRKLVITTLSDEARPQVTSIYTWNLAPAFNDAAFTFVPPPEAKKITLAEVPTGREIRGNKP